MKPQVKHFAAFESRKGTIKPNSQHGHASAKITSACSFAGIKYGKNILDGITFYTARHTATSELVRSGVDLRTAGKYTGHSDETMTMYYSHGDQRSLNSAAEILEQNMGKILYDGEFLESKHESSKTKLA